MRKDDLVRLMHMRDWTLEALSMAKGRTRADLESDRMFFNSTIRCLEVIGEAASRVSRETQEAHPQIPWSKIVGMRNRLIHDYHDIHLNIVWKTLGEELPLLKTHLDSILEYSSVGRAAFSESVAPLPIA